MKRVLSRIAMGSALLCLFPAAPYAADHDHHAMAAPAAALTDGVVKKIDKAGSMLTLTHGPLENLGMPGMTMAFKVQVPGAVERLKVGDKVRFLADYVGGEIVIVRLEAAK
ncbi:MAG: copper-binding protein [Rhodocyclaceae bacterium]|nr:copper-binding protein [Rhodocyclaceae bacterium]